jgi:hypothetical protein
MPKQLVPVEKPGAVEYIWEWFRELSPGRMITEFGPGNLTYTEIKAWADLKRIPIKPWEVDAIKWIDSVYLNIAYDRGK